MRVTLDGDDWRLRGLTGDEWARDDLATLGAREPWGWLPGTVPGSVQDDLWRAGRIPDPYHGRNSLAIEWVSERTWVYTKMFGAPPPTDGGRAHLHLTGVDYAARVILNGVALGEHASMFAPAIFEVGSLLRATGGNELVVVLAPAPPEPGQLGRTSMTRSTKARMGYWWDFCPRAINLGLWDEVYLDYSGPVTVEDVWVRAHLAADLGRADVAVAITCDARAATQVVADVALDHDGAIVARGHVAGALAAGRGTLHLALALDAPHLWWPNGQGAQALYRATVHLATDLAGAYPAERAVSFGVRRLELLPNEGAEPGAPPYTFAVNGRRLYITGWNWVPIDIFYGPARAEKLAHLLALAAGAGANLLRVLGVGLIERAAFYDWCDRLGLLVWQDFPLTSSATDRKPSEDPAYIARVVAEAERIIPRRRNHPSLALWCGGNELESLEKVPLDDREPVLAALRAVVARHDPDRPWLPTSARGRQPFNGLGAIARDPGGLHDVHGPWLYEGLTAHYTLYNAGTALFHSEFAVEGLANRATLDATLPAGEQWPVTLDAPTWAHRAAWWVRPEFWATLFGPLGDLDLLIGATQLLQAEGVRYAIEANRRRMYRNSGVLPWQFNEPYPMAAGTAAVDYYGRPKALYAAVARAYAPLLLTARFDTIAWGGRERFAATIWAIRTDDTSLRGASLRARLLRADGGEARSWEQTVAVAGDAATALLAIACPLAALGAGPFFLDLALTDPAGGELARARYPFSATADLGPLLALPATTLAARAEAAGDRWAIDVANTGGWPVVQVRLADGRAVQQAGYARFADNHFCLLPGEARRVAVAWDGVPPGERRVSVGAWNAAPSELRV
jgi:beta-mannosidase